MHAHTSRPTNSLSETNNGPVSMPLFRPRMCLAVPAFPPVPSAYQARDVHCFSNSCTVLLVFASIHETGSLCLPLTPLRCNFLSMHNTLLPPTYDANDQLNAGRERGNRAVDVSGTHGFGHLALPTGPGPCWGGSATTPRAYERPCTQVCAVLHTYRCALSWSPFHLDISPLPCASRRSRKGVVAMSVVLLCGNTCTPKPATIMAHELTCV